tara:strand:+ start:5611 stop:6747 length:1137 start_codon:yes stop_codon:yes gene_type:complete
MKVLFFYESCGRGGQQTYTLELIKALLEKGHQVEYLYCQDNEEMLDSFQSICRVSKLKTLLNPGEYKYKPWKLFFIFKEIKSFVHESFDVVITGSGIGSLLVGRSLKRTRISHYRLMGCSLKQVERNIFRYYQLLKIDNFINGYFGWEEVFRELREKSVDDTKFIKTPFGVNTSVFFPMKIDEIKEFKEKLKLNQDKLVIGWVGRICRTMQVWGTVEFAESLISHGFEDFQLLFVGGGPDQDLLIDLLIKKNLLQRSCVTGWIDYDEINKYYNVMDVVPLLAKDPQGGSIIREAMAAGKLTVSVDGPSKVQSEIMKEDYSLLVPSKNFAHEAAQSFLQIYKKGLIEKMGLSAREASIKHLSFDKVANIIDQTIRSNKL